MIDSPLTRAKLAIDEGVALGVSRVTAVFASHNDLDHIGTVFVVARHFSAEVVFYNHASVLPTETTQRRKLRAVLREAASMRDYGIRGAGAERGAKGEVGTIMWEVLAPLHDQIAAAQAAGNPNHASIVLRVTYAGVRLLVPGDADGASWELMRRDGCDLQADVLQVPHHGAPLEPVGEVEGIEWLLDCVAATHAIVSAGAGNPYDHPDATVIAALQARLPTRRWWCTCPLAMLPSAGTVRVDINDEGHLAVSQP